MGAYVAVANKLHHGSYASSSCSIIYLNHASNDTCSYLGPWVRRCYSAFDQSLGILVLFRAAFTVLGVSILHVDHIKTTPSRPMYIPYSYIEPFGLRSCEMRLPACLQMRMDWGAQNMEAQEWVDSMIRMYVPGSLDSCYSLTIFFGFPTWGPQVIPFIRHSATFGSAQALPLEPVCTVHVSYSECHGL